MNVYSFFARLYSKLSTAVYRGKSFVRSKYYPLILSKCGKNFKVYGQPWITSTHLIEIGDNFTINNGAMIAPRGKVIIGNYVTMSRGSQITAGSLDTKYWTNERYKYHRHICKDVFINEGTWLGVNSIILPGVSIKGKGVIVAAGAVVTSDVNESYVVIGGVPAKVIKKL